MKKEDLKAAIKANFENNEFATAMGLNDSLLQEYETVAGKRSAAALVSYYRKKSEEATEEETITQEEVGSVEEIVAPTEEVKDDEPEYQFNLNEPLDLTEIENLLEKGNKTLVAYCIVTEEFKQVSDTEQFIRTTMAVKEDGFGWKSFEATMGVLGGKKGVTERKLGSFWKSECGLPVGEEITKKTIYRIGDALRKFASRKNASAITCVTSI